MLLPKELFSQVTGASVDPLPVYNDVAPNRRRCTRIAIGCRARIFPLFEGVVLEGCPTLVLDMSLSGIGLLMSEPMCVGDEFVIHLPRQDHEPLQLQCIVRRCERGGTGGFQFILGATFELVLNLPEGIKLQPEPAAEDATSAQGATERVGDWSGSDGYQDVSFGGPQDSGISGSSRHQWWRPENLLARLAEFWDAWAARRASKKLEAKVRSRLKANKSSSSVARESLETKPVSELAPASAIATIDAQMPISTTVGASPEPSSAGSELPRKSLLVSSPAPAMTPVPEQPVAQTPAPPPPVPQTVVVTPEPAPASAPVPSAAPTTVPCKPTDEVQKPKEIQIETPVVESAPAAPQAAVPAESSSTHAEPAVAAPRIRTVFLKSRSDPRYAVSRHPRRRERPGRH